MFDYRTWVDRAVKMTRELPTRLAGEIDHATADAAPPLDSADCARISADLRIPIPEPVVQFVTQGSADCSCSYLWLPPSDEVAQLKLISGENSAYGGASLCKAESFQQWQEWCYEAATQTWFDDEPEFQEFKDLWLHCFPFARMSNADYLALDPRHDDNLPVVYLSHDDESKVISTSFEGFLQAWEKLCYIGPEHWMLEPFIDLETGYLTGKSQRADQLRALFAPTNS